MKKEELGPMDAELRSLLRRGAPPLEAPSGAEARLLARLATSLPIPPGDGGGGGASAPSAAGAAAGKLAGLTTSKLVGPVIASLLLGGGVGAAVTKAVQEEKVRVVYVDRPAPSTPPAPPLAPSEAPAARVEDLPRARASEPSARPAAQSAAPASQLSAERLLLDRARAAFARGEHDAALSALDEHQTKYPSGLLTEEREALAVRALASLGRSAEAHDRGRRFVARYPESLMLPAVEAAIADAGDPR